LSRFDILCVVRDTVDPSEDERLANFVVNSHGNAHPTVQQAEKEAAAKEKDNNQGKEKEKKSEKEGAISQELLRKYILFAREKCRPKLYQIDEDKVARLFSDMRRESLATGAYPITVSRWIEIKIVHKH
jgi:DNA replication licensing factor MCM2